MDTLTDTAPAPARALDAPAPAPLVASPHPGAFLYLDRRGWMAMAGICAAAVGIGFAMGKDLHRSPLIPVVLAAAMTVSLARAGWGWLRGPARRARLREGALSHVDAYGGGVYGTGAGITLLVLSAASLREEWARAGGWTDFLRGMTWDFWMGFSGESIANAVQAGIWPIDWYTKHGLVAALLVGAAAWAGDALAAGWRRRDPLAAVDAGTPAGEVRTDGRSAAMDASA
ncbi:MAG TPA: hypothetical protein VLK84_02280 [Longimicrobium sp.]|nr:hypothetical protein [Longimicrobium sp.]